MIRRTAFLPATSVILKAVRSFLIVLAFAGILTGSARADDEREISTLKIVKDQLGVFANDIALKLDVFSFDDSATQRAFADEDYGLAFDMDIRRRRASINVGIGDENAFALHLDARLRLVGGAPRLRARLDLGLAGHRLTLQLPDVQIRPRWYQGEMYMEYSVPLLEGRF